MLYNHDNFCCRSSLLNSTFYSRYLGEKSWTPIVRGRSNFASPMHRNFAQCALARLALLMKNVTADFFSRSTQYDCFVLTVFFH